MPEETVLHDISRWECATRVVDYIEGAYKKDFKAPHLVVKNIIASLFKDLESGRGCNLNTSCPTKIRLDCEKLSEYRTAWESFSHGDRVDVSELQAFLTNLARRAREARLAEQRAFADGAKRVRARTY